MFCAGYNLLEHVHFSSEKKQRIEICNGRWYGLWQPYIESATALSDNSKCHIKVLFAIEKHHSPQNNVYTKEKYLL